MRETSSGLSTTGSFLRRLRNDEIIASNVPPFQCLLVKKTQGRYAPFDSGGSKLLIAQQVRLKLADLVAAQQLRRFAKVIGKRLDREDASGIT